MAQYDPSILQQFADLLYRKARTLIIIWTALAVVIGLVASAFIGPVVAKGFGIPDQSFAVAAVVVIIVGYIGYAIGRARAFFYKLQAQLALCQKQIEANTRQLASQAARTAAKEAPDG